MSLVAMGLVVMLFAGHLFAAEGGSWSVYPGGHKVTLYCPKEEDPTINVVVEIVTPPSPPDFESIDAQDVTCIRRLLVGLPVAGCGEWRRYFTPGG